MSDGFSKILSVYNKLYKRNSVDDLKKFPTILFKCHRCVINHKIMILEYVYQKLYLRLLLIL